MLPTKLNLTVDYFRGVDILYFRLLVAVINLFLMRI